MGPRLRAVWPQGPGKAGPVQECLGQPAASCFAVQGWGWGIDGDPFHRIRSLEKMVIDESLSVATVVISE